MEWSVLVTTGQIVVHRWVVATWNTGRTGRPQLDSAVSQTTTPESCADLQVSTTPPVCPTVAQWFDCGVGSRSAHVTLCRARKCGAGRDNKTIPSAVPS